MTTGTRTESNNDNNNDLAAGHVWASLRRSRTDRRERREDFFFAPSQYGRLAVRTNERTEWESRATKDVTDLA
jgi:hypothetical protein